MQDKTVAVILAGGSGERFGGEKPKQFFKVGGKTIIEHTIDVFESYRPIDDICIVINPDYRDYFKRLIEKNSYKKIKYIIDGGKTRQESSRIALFHLKDSGYRYVLTHDAIRPLLSHEILDRIMEALKNYRSVDVAIPTADTIIKVNENRIIEDIPNRKYIMRGQTPQGFEFETIFKAHKLAFDEGFESSPDDCYLVLRYNLADTYVVTGSEENIKITYQIDLHLLDKLLQIKSKTFSDIDIDEIARTLKDKVIVIFGGSKGIGKSISSIAKTMKASVYAYGSDVDIRNPESVKDTLKNIFSKNGRIDAVIVTAGIIRKGKLEDLSLSDIYDQININLAGSIIVSKFSIPYLKKSRGHLLMFASSSYTFGREDYTIYSATKAGIVNFMQGLSKELSIHGVKVNAINPERTLTPMRTENFKDDDISLLLDPDFVGLMTLNALTKEVTGSVIDVRKSMESKDILDKIKNIIKHGLE